MQASVGLVSVQDLGRPNLLHRGVPRSGALAPSLLAATNVGVGNDENAAAIEVLGQLTLKCTAPTWIATSNGTLRHCAAGEELRVQPGSDQRVAYACVRGGIDVPERMQSRSTWIEAAFGGFNGRLLQRGDVLPVGASRTTSSRSFAVETFTKRKIKVLRGPDAHRFDEQAMRLLTSAAGVISASSNRVATRLDMLRLPYVAVKDEPSHPMIEGAIEVTSDGTPLVLGPEHPITGGYPVIAVIERGSLDAFHRLPVGTRVEFEFTR